MQNYVIAIVMIVANVPAVIFIVIVMIIVLTIIICIAANAVCIRSLYRSNVCV